MMVIQLFYAVHLDSPLHDGFGVVIVTVCVHQNAQIILIPSDDKAICKPYVFNASEGDVYVLSGAARNIFDHGVICENEKRVTSQQSTLTKKRQKNIGRESLNFRFSLHGNKPGMPFFVGDEIPVQIR